jgi:hypothetical protein
MPYRHDVFRGPEAPTDQAPEPAIQDLQIPLPVVGRHSPSVLALRSLAKASLVFGSYVLVLRLVCLVSPDIARFVPMALTAVFAIALAVHWFAPGRGAPEWPVWVGAAILVVFGASSFFPDVGRLVEAPSGQGPLSTLVPPLLQAGVLVLVLVHFLLPVVKRTTSRLSRGPLVLGLVAAHEGGACATAYYFPESDFSAWVVFAFMVLFAVPGVLVVADQYAKFQMAMNRAPGTRVLAGAEKVANEVRLRYSALGPFIVIAALWCGNLVFISNLGWIGASFTGFHAFLGALAIYGFLRNFDHPLRPYRAAWAALSFFLTYNLQRVSNPNVFQLRWLWREPLVRLAVVGACSAFLGVGILHLSGVQAPPGSNRVRPAQVPLWQVVLPQSYPELFNEEQLSEPARGVYRRHAASLAADGDAPLPTATPVRSLTGLVIRGLLFLAGGPALFLFLLATTQGHFLTTKEDGLP